MRYRVACLTSHPVQYQAPLFRHLARHPSIDLTVFFMTGFSLGKYYDPGFATSFQWDVPLLEGYRYNFLPAVPGTGGLSFWRPLVYGLRQHLAAGAFHALWVHGYSHQATLRAIGIARRYGTKVLMRGESHLARGSDSPAGRFLKHLVLPRIFGLADGFLAIGSRNRDYYLSYGVPRERVFMTPYAVDNEFFRNRAAQAASRREELRRDLELDRGRPVILFASKLQRRKRASDLLEAYARLRSASEQPRPYLFFVGDGEEREPLQARVRELGLDSVRFLGFRNQTEMPSFYDLCDVFVLPSEREPWGLVVNEAMNAGKPVVVSDEVGAAADLVVDGDNGFLVRPGDITMLSQRLGLLIAKPELALAMGRRSLERIASWNFEADTRGLLAALEAVTGRGTSFQPVCC